MMMAATARLRVVFEEQRMLSKSKKKEGLNRSWVLLKSQHNTISDLASHLHRTFRLHRTCPDGIILSMDGFVLPPFESTCIFKDKDIVCVKRKGSISTENKATGLPSAPRGHRLLELPKLISNEEFQEETGGYKTMSQEDNNGQFEDEVFVESKSDGDAISKKRKASKKLKSSRKKKIKLSSAEKLAVTPDIHMEENGMSLVKKDNDKSSNLSRQPDKSSTLDFHKESNDINGPMHDETRSCQPEDHSGTKKFPSRSARRKKAKRKWLREQLKLEKEKLLPSPVLEKDRQQLPVKDNNCIVSDVHQQSDEESEAEDDIVPVEIRPGHIRFEPLRKDQAVPQNRLPVETFQWNGITSKKKGQKWGKEKISSHKQDDYKKSNQKSPYIQNAEKKRAFNPLDFDKLTPYTSLPKERDLIAYRLIELSASWTPELSSFRVGKISKYDAKSNRIWLERVLEYPFDFGMKTDEEASSVQSDPSPYGEDGSLEIDYSSLADVRMVKHGSLDSENVVASGDDPTKAINSSIDEQHTGDQTAAGSCKPCIEREGHIPSRENGEVNVWDEINETLTAKKAQLLQDNGWSREESSGMRSWSQRALRCSALGPTMAFLRAQNEL